MAGETANKDRSVSRFIASLIVGASVLLFLASLTQNAYRVDKSDPPWVPSVTTLLLGWLGILDGIIAWYANPALLATWVMLFFRPTRWIAFFSTLAAIGLALSFLWRQDILKDEGGTRQNIVGYGLGYWVWIASIAVALLGCGAMIFRDRAVRRRMRESPTPSGL